MLALINTPLSLEVNYDSGLFVGLTIYDDSGLAPVQVLPVGNINGVMPMLNVVDTLYRAKLTPTSSGTFIFRKAVYTDGTYTVLSPDYSRSSESAQVVNLNTVLTNLANLDVAVSTRLPTSGYSSPLDTTGTASAVWDALISGHAIVGTFGAVVIAGSGGGGSATVIERHISTVMSVDVPVLTVMSIDIDSVK